MFDKEAHLFFLHQELRKKGTVSFETLKINTHIDDDQEMMQLLLLYLDERLDNFNFNSNYRQNRDLKKCLNFIKYSPRKLEISPDTYLKIARHLRDLGEIADYKLANPGELINEIYVNDNYRLLTSFKNEIVDYIHHLDQEGYNIYDTNSTYVFMRDNILQQMDYDYIKKIVKDYPSIVNIGKKDEPNLVEIVADSFITSLNKKTSYDEILYYQKVLLLFLQSPVFSRDLQKTEATLSKGLDIINNSDKTIKEKQGEVLLLHELNSNIHTVKKVIEEEEKKRRNLRIKYQLNTDYSCEEKEEALKIGIQNDKFVDERDKYVITIDSPETNRFEDAIFYRLNDDESIDVTIYTPDVADFITEDSLLAKRAESSALNYFIPDDIMHNYFSFDAGGNRFAIAHEMHFDANLNLQDVQIRRSRINIKRNMYYADVKDAIKNKDQYLLNLYTIALNIENKHNDKTIVNYKQAYNKMKTSGNFNVGSDIIKNICIELNSSLSNIYTLPFICHNHTKDGERVLATLPEYFNDVERQERIATIIKSTNPHASLAPSNPENKKNYADFCSPLRKPDSLWNQRVILDRDNAEKIYKYACIVDAHAKEINEKNRRINYYEKELIESKKKTLK
jgi:hypothetical protein